MSRSRIFLGLVIVAAASAAPPALARKTNQAVYQDPFDLAAGGAALTRATKEGRIFANPALLPQGGSFHRWSGASISLFANRESVETVRSVIGGSHESQAGEGNIQKDPLEDYLNEIIKNPLHLGSTAALSWITRYFGFTVFNSVAPDFRMYQIGSVGTPELAVAMDSYIGAAFGVPIWTPFRWLSLGVTAKYLIASEIEERLQLGEASLAESEELVASLRDVGDNRGLGVDAGALVFLQGRTVDFSLAAKVDDVGHTKFQDRPSEFKQVVSAGAGVALHTSADALHLAVDYRDLMQSYDEETFKRVYAGAKLLLRTYVGLAAGVYHGYPTYGAELDLIFMRVAFTSYTRELGSRPGIDPRQVYLVSLSMGY